MTQKEFANQILQIVDNGRSFDNKSDKEIIKDLVSFLSILEPKDRAVFSRWGKIEHHSTKALCWK